jgi:hypothetical protein
MPLCRNSEGEGLAILPSEAPAWHRKRQAPRVVHASRPMTQPGDAPQPADGEGQNRTGDTTIFSRGSWCNCRARPEATGEDLPANRVYRSYRDLRSVSRDTALVRARGRQVDVRGARSARVSTDAHDAGESVPTMGERHSERKPAGALQSRLLFGLGR